MSITEFDERIIREISPNELMIHNGSQNHYFRVGKSAIDSIHLGLRRAGIEASEVKRVLDLPCGHGRVLRYLRASFPEAEITACDLLRDGVDFCASTFGAIPAYSEDDPRTIPIERDAYDLIWVGSLFTHFDVPLWDEFLEVLRASLRPGGLLIFTTAGRHVYRQMIEGRTYGLPRQRVTLLLRDYERRGFGYARYPSDYLGSKSYYGVSRARPDWVLAKINRLGGLRVVHFAEKAWDNHQDCYACVRDDLLESDTAPQIGFGRYVKHRIKEALWQIRQQ